MASSSQAVPKGYHSVTPYLAVDDGARAIAFYKAAFGATEVMRMPGPGGKVGHAEIRIGDLAHHAGGRVSGHGVPQPQDLRRLAGRPASLCRGRGRRGETGQAAGAKELRPVKDQFYGDRTGSFEDPFGHVWHIATRKEDLSPDELKRRAEQAMQQGG